MKTVLSIMSVILLLSGCGDSQGSLNEEWTSFIYPSKDNFKRSMEYSKFKTINECKIASLEKLKSLQLENDGFFECGLNCVFNDGMKTLVCERVVKQ
ncbi:MAG: hypothetical protein ACNI3C_10635 [Candidatus Marinarcus sp.]|uniref:hypothetical protein n=1 Tax=Candidatus Marinarcus sp. TaxID=3100987 RepID=UPI003B002463